MNIMEFGVIFMIVMAIILGIALIFIGWNAIYGQDIDPKAYCLYNNTHPFNDLCIQQLHEKEYILDLIQKMCESHINKCSFDEGP